MIYNFDTNTILRQLTPKFPTTDKHYSWLYALFTPFTTLKTSFNTYITDKNYELDFNGQVISLERLLNDQYDNTLRRIFIEDSAATEQPFLFFSSDNNVSEGDSWLFFDGDTNVAITDFWFFEEVSQYVVDFVVNVPSALVYEQAELIAYVNKYKLAGKSFAIATF